MSFRYRDVQLLDDNPVDDSGTKPIDLNIQQPITELTVDMELTNGASIVHDEPVEKAISKIEITDGGATYFSLTGQEAVAAACFDVGHWPTHRYNESLSEKQRITIPMRFGRWLGDPNFALTPPRLNNPQLKVTWSKASGHLTGSLTLGIWAKVMEDVAAPAQALMWKDVQSFTSAASGDIDVKLPHDYPYRRALIRAYKSDTIPTNILTNFRLDCDAGRFTPFDLNVKEFRYIMQNFFGPYMLKKMDRVSQNSYHQTWMAGDTFASLATETVGNYPQAWATGSIMYQQVEAVTADIRAEALIWGYMPHSCFAWQFGDPDTPETWFPTKDYAEEILWLTQGAASATVSVAVQQPRPLP
jgi:hypothetical protein